MIIDITGDRVSVWERGKCVYSASFREIIVRDNGIVVAHVL